MLKIRDLIMIKIDLPRDCQNYADVIDSCCSIMRNSNPLKGKIKENKDALLRVSQYYKKTAKIIVYLFIYIIDVAKIVIFV